MCMKLFKQREKTALGPTLQYYFLAPRNGQFVNSRIRNFTGQKKTEWNKSCVNLIEKNKIWKHRTDTQQHVKRGKALKGTPVPDGPQGTKKYSSTRWMRPNLYRRILVYRTILPLMGCTFYVCGWSKFWNCCFLIMWENIRILFSSVSMQMLFMKIIPTGVWTRQSLHLEALYNWKHYCPSTLYLPPVPQPDSHWAGFAKWADRSVCVLAEVPTGIFSFMTQ